MRTLSDGSAHVLLCFRMIFGDALGIDDGLVAKLTGGLPNEYLKALTELYVNFHGTYFLIRISLSNTGSHDNNSRLRWFSAIEPRTFTLKSPRSFFTLYAPPDRSPKESLQAWEEEIAFMSKAVSCPFVCGMILGLTLPIFSS